MEELKVEEGNAGGVLRRMKEKGKNGANNREVAVRKQTKENILKNKTK